MLMALAASRSAETNSPSVVSAICDSSSALWLAGEKAIKNSGNAISSAPRLHASFIKSRAARRFSVFSVEDWIWATAALLMFRSSVWINIFVHAIQGGRDRQAEREKSLPEFTLSLSEGFEMTDSGFCEPWTDSG